MSRDADSQQRLWLFLGHGGKTASPGIWRYWKKPGTDREWIIAAPHGLAEFEQRHHDVYFHGKKILSEKTQWDATWKALAYFYEHVVPAIEPLPLSPKEGQEKNAA